MRTGKKKENEPPKEVIKKQVNCWLCRNIFYFQALHFRVVRSLEIALKSKGLRLGFSFPSIKCGVCTR